MFDSRAPPSSVSEYHRNSDAAALKRDERIFEDKNVCIRPSAVRSASLV